MPRQSPGTAGCLLPPGEKMRGIIPFSSHLTHKTDECWEGGKKAPTQSSSIPWQQRECCSQKHGRPIREVDLWPFLEVNKKKGGGATRVEVGVEAIKRLPHKT